MTRMNKTTSTTEDRREGVLSSKTYLYLTEFFAGMSVMAVELGASRLLAPYFSSSQIVWTIIIGTIMIAMALGNIFGGRWADKDPDPDRLYARLLVAAVWTAAIPVIGKLVIVAVSAALVFTVSTGFLIWAAFLSCMLVFVFPCFLLGTVTPSLVKYTVSSLDNSGSTVGKLNAFNTIGSIIGTFVPTFLSIPAFGTAVTFLIFSGILMALGLIYFISCRRRAARCIVCTVLFIGCCLGGNRLGFAFWEKGLTFEGESVYNYLQVKDDDYCTILSTNVLFGVQSVTIKDGSLTGMYYDYALAAPMMTDPEKHPAGKDCDILVLGMGTGTYAAQCSNYLGGCSVEGVEIDDRITDLAHEYFSLDESIKVTTYDGRAFLSGITGGSEDRKYVVIMVDAYQDITIPFQMSSKEFFTQVKSFLAPGGVMVVNMNMRSDRDGGINDRLTATIKSVFPEVAAVDVSGSTNRELFASESGGLIEDLEKNLQLISDPELSDMMYMVKDGLAEDIRDYPEDWVLTDDRAPVELLGMQVIDDLISQELEYYKDIVKKDGIKGLME